MLDLVGTDVVSHVPISDASGSASADDVSGNSNGGTYNGTVALQQGSLVGGIQGCGGFDGSTGYIDMGSGTEWDVGSSESWTSWAWVRPSPIWDSTRTHRVCMRYDGSNAGWGFWLEPQNTNVVAWVTDGADSNFATADEANFDRLIMIGLHVDRSSDEHSVIVDGALKDTTGISSVGALGSGSLNVGRRPDSTNNHVDGKIQHFHAASTALTSTKLSAIYEQGAQFFDRGRSL